MCTATTYKTKDFYFGRTLDYEFSYGDEVTITPRNFKFNFRKIGEMNSHYAIIGMAYVIEDYPLYYDAINEKVISDNFITDGTSIDKPYKIGADPTTGYIYITASDYKTNGDVYAFDASGKKLFQFEVGLNPVKAVFVKR